MVSLLAGCARELIVERTKGNFILIDVVDGAVIAAEAVVTSNVPPYSIYGGNPAKLIRKRFSEDVINALLELQWWNWPYEKITRNLRAIFGTDIEALKSSSSL